MMKTKKMTKLVTLLLALAMVFSLAACSSGKGKDKADGSTDIAALIATEPNSADERPSSISSSCRRKTTFSPQTPTSGTRCFCLPTKTAP